MRPHLLLLPLLLAIALLLAGCSRYTEEDYLTFQVSKELAGETPFDVMARLPSAPETKRFRMDEMKRGYWVYLDETRLNEAVEVIRIVPGLVHALEIYYTKNGVLEKSQPDILIGRAIEVSEWTIKQPRFVIPLSKDGVGRSGVLMRLEMKNIISVSLLSFSNAENKIQEDLDALSFFFMLGAIVMLTVVTGAVWISTKDQRYCWLATAFISLTFIEISAQGYGHAYLWGNSPAFSIRCISFASALFLISYLSFSEKPIVALYASNRSIHSLLNAGRYLSIALGLNVAVGNFNFAVGALSAYSVVIIFFTVGLQLLKINKASTMECLVLFGQAVIGFVGLARMADIIGIGTADHYHLPIFKESEYMLIWVAIISLIFFFIARHVVVRNLELVEEQQHALSSLEERVASRTHELEISRNESLALGALQRDFLATMSHELRTPLSSIIGLSRMLRRHEVNQDTIARDLGIVERMAIHILNMVDDGLDFVRNKTISESHNVKPVDMRALCRDFLSVGEWLSHNQTNAFKFTRSREMPVTLIFDERKVRQIVINFLSNAGRYCVNGEISCNVSFYENIKPTLKIDIIDNGRGMSEADVKKYLQPFVKSRDSIGLGLGLALTKGLIEQLEGTLNIKSQVDVGTHISVEIPCVKLEEDVVSNFDEEERGALNAYADTQPMTMGILHQIDMSLVDHLRQLLINGMISEAEEVLNQLDADAHKGETTVRFISHARRYLNNLELDDLIEYINFTVAQSQQESAL